MYPQGNGGVKSRYIDGVLTFFNAAGQIIYAINPLTRSLEFPVGAAILSDGGNQITDVLISAVDIIGTGAGQFGHAEGFPLVAPQGADKAVTLVEAVMVNDRDTAAYTDGGNITVNLSGGGAAQTGLVSAANSLGAATDTIHRFVPLSTAAIAMVANAGLHLVAAAAFTNPGTAAGVVRVRTVYRVYTLGL
jgi:hypothetical protein